MYSTFTPTPPSVGYGPPQCGVFESACQNFYGVSASTATPAAMRHQESEQQQPLQCDAQQLQQYRHVGSAGGDTAANPPRQGGSPAVNGRRKQHAHMWNPQLTAHCKQVNTSNNQDEQAVSTSQKPIQKDSPSSPATVEKPGFLTRLLRTGRGAEKRSHSSTQSDRHGQHLQEPAPIATGRSLTPPASAVTFCKAHSSTALCAKEKSQPPVSHSGPRHRSRHWLHHQRGKQQDQQNWQPQQPQQQEGLGSRAATPGTTRHVVQAPCCCSRKPSPFATPACSVPLRDHQQVERLPGTLATTFPLPTEVPCMAQRVLPVHSGLPACQHGFLWPRHPSFVVNRQACRLPHQQPHRQIFFAAGEANRGLGTQGGSLSNGSRLTRRLLPSYTSENVASGAVPSQMRYGKPSSFVSKRNPFSLCSPMRGCFPATHLFADVSISEGSTAASAIQPMHVTMQASPSPAAVAGSTATHSLARVAGGQGKAVIDPKAYSTFNVNCFFTQLYLLDSAKRLELIAARISHSMQSRAFSYWVLKHRYSIAKHIWDRKVSKEIEHLRRLRNNIERSQQNYAAETARKRAEADAGTLDKSAELLIIQEQQCEALAQQKAAADEQIERVQRYKSRRGAVLGSLLLEHGLKRLLYEYQSFSLFALRSSLLTDDDILQHAIRMLPKFVPPSWKKLDPARQAELLRSEYAHLVEPATIHLTSLREMYRLHRLDLEARSRRLGRYYRLFFARTRCFTILECIQRSQTRRLLSDAYTMLRYYSWTMRAIEGESLACNAAIARLREAREQRCPSPHTSNSSNPLVLPSYARRRRNRCNGCGCIFARCCNCSNVTTSVPCRQHCPFPRGTVEEEEEDTASRTAAALLDSQSDMSVQQQNQLQRPRKAVTGRDEMSGIFFPRFSDGSPVPRRSSRESASRNVDAGSMQQSSGTAWIDATGYAGDGSRRGSPKEKRSFCNGSSAGVQVSCSCCCSQSQQGEAAAALSCISNAGLPSRGTVLNSDMTLPPATTAVPRACVSRSLPETAEQDAAVIAATATMAAIRRQCGTEARTEEGCTLLSSEPSWAHISATAKPLESSSRCLSPACTAREQCQSPRPCPAHDISDLLLFPAEAGQQQHRPKPEIHKRCFVETSALQTHRLRHSISSPVGQVRFSPNALACYAGGEQSFSWKQRSAQATPRQQRQENEQLQARGDGTCLQENHETFLDAEVTPSRLARVAEGSAAGSAAIAGIDDDATPQKTSAGFSFTSTAPRQAAAYVRAAPDESSYFPLPKPVSVFAGDNYSSSDSAAADISSSAVAAALPSAAVAKAITPALHEAERNAALILGVEPQLRSHTNVRPVPMEPITITFKHEKKSLWDDPPKPGEIPEIERIHVIGRNWTNTQ